MHNKALWSVFSMPQTKQRLSKIRREAGRLFALESGIQRSASWLNLAALLGVLYLTLPISPSHDRLDGLHYGILILLAVFLAINYAQQFLLIRLRRKWMELEEQSSHDGLTRAFNRETFEEILDEEMNRARRYNFPLSLCILDLDNYKTYNDTYGHPKGDRLLADFAERIQKAIRSADCMARYGGDEFCVLLPHTSLNDAEKFLSRMLLETQEWLDFSFSAGVTVYRPSEDKIAFITRADAALYQAKREGKSRIRCLIGDNDDQVILKS